MDTAGKLKAQLAIVTGLVVLYFVFKSVYFLYSAALGGIIFLAIPALGYLILKLWFKLASVLGWINSRILLSLVFYLFLFPIATISKIFSKSSLNLDKSPSSMFSERNQKYKKEDLENTW